METINDKILMERFEDTSSHTKINRYFFTTTSGALDLSMLLLRCSIGIILFVVGSGKVLGWFGGFGPDVTLRFYTQMGISHPFAYMSFYAEFIGGLFLTFGFLTRAVSIAVIINMLVATILSLPKGFLGPNGASYPFIFLIIAISIFLVGPMKISIDSMIFGKYNSYYG